MLRFEVEAQTAWGEKVAVVGSGPLGGWSLASCLVLEPTAYPFWSGSVAVPPEPLEYKYAMVRPLAQGGQELVRWEFDGGNRRVEPGAADEVLLSERFGDGQHRSLSAAAEPRQPEAAPEERAPVEAAPEEAAPPEAAPAGAAAAPPQAAPVEAAPEEAAPEEAAPVELAPEEAAPKEVHRRASGVLGSLDVDPMVRFSRLVRSRSGFMFPAKYEVCSGSVLGTGMSGGVTLARVRDTGLEVAVKTLPTAGLSDSQRELTVQEVQNQLSMDHPNICRLLEVYEEPECLRLVLERLRGPDLYEHWSRRGRYSERDAAGCVRQICSAVAYCHSRGVCHRDLKLENFCLEDESDGARVKMIDFGLSCATSTPMTDAVGTLYYVAPEVLRGQYDEKCDMWSLGVMTFILTTGQAPFKGTDDRDTVRRIRRGAYTLPRQGLSPDCKGFIEELLRLDPTARLDAKAALAHSWLVDAEVDFPGTPLDAGVLEGLRALTRSNAVKRAFLSVVAPVCTEKEVSRWADQFAALDREGTGMVAVQDLAASLQKELSTSEAEAVALSSALAGADGGELVSYSAFLSACLATRLAAFEGRRIREFYDRLDKDKDGRVSVSDVEQALGGDESKLEGLREWLADTGASDDSLSYEEFRWLMLRPNQGLRGLRQLLSSDSANYRVDTVRTRQMLPSDGSDEGVEAKRRENAMWRLWWLDGGPASAGMTQPPDLSAKSESCISSTTLLSSEVVAGVGDADHLLPAWRVATAAAKDGDSTEARKENVAWRKWAMESSGQTLPGRTPSDLMDA